MLMNIFFLLCFVLIGQVQQEDLIRQLQEQHFHQYMTQIYQQQLIHQQQQYKQVRTDNICVIQR